MKKGRNDIIAEGYKKNSDKYDDYITSSKLWSKIVVKLIWGLRDEEYVDTIVPLLPDDFHGKLLDIPAGTAVFTHNKYRQMKDADIVCVDYSQEMLNHAVSRLAALDNVKCLQGDAGCLPFESEAFDIVLSMNGVHAFPDKQKAFNEIFRVLKSGGKFVGCFYIKGERAMTDFFVRNIFVPNGTFTPPFMSIKDVKTFLDAKCSDVQIWNKRSIVCFEGIKK